MKPCWSDGDLRAHLDGELSADAQAQIAAHLETCAECEARYDEIAGRAALVTRLLDLPEVASRAPVPATRSHRRQWTVAGLALAAAAAIAFVRLPKPVAPSKPAPVAHAPVAAPAALSVAALRPPTPQVHAISHRAPAPVEFLRLDDDPIETGTVVRISDDDGQLVADVILGPDGRAHAIRLVRNQ